MDVLHDHTIFDYIKTQEAMYKRPIPINGKWDWSMHDHIELSELYKNSQLSTGKSDFKPVKNITRPILNLQYRTEDIDVKDVQIYVDDSDKYYLSFLIKKYHDDVFVVENDLDTFFDELNESRIDFGGGLSKKLNKACPEVVPLQSIVFCDQTDILSGPIGIKHYYSPDQLLEMADKGWGKKSNGATVTVDDVIALSREEKKDDKNGTIAQTPGRYIEVYEVHGNFPKSYADPYNASEKYETRLFIVAFYQSESSKERNGVILYTALEPESPFDFIKRDAVFGRALGFGGAEELFEPQVWVNYDMIRMQEMLDAASKTILKTTDPTVATRNKIKDMDNLDILELQEGRDISQVDTFPRNLRLFEKSISEWEAHAQQMGAANDSIMGEPPTAGTPFKLQELVTAESRGLHDFRRGKFAKHLEEIYKKRIIPHIQKEIVKGAKFLSELSLEELQYVSEALVTNEAAHMVKEKILNGEMIVPNEIEQHKQMVRNEFKKKGTKHFIEILKGEFKNTPLSVKVNIAGKTKNLALATDKITNIFRFAFSNPQGFMQTMQIPGMGKSFNQILEFAGLSPVDFSGIDQMALSQAQQAPQASPIQPRMQPQM